MISDRLLRVHKLLGIEDDYFTYEAERESPYISANPCPELFGCDKNEKVRKTMELEEVIKAVDDEPEFPGEMPDQIYEVIKDAISREDKDYIQECFRETVKLTKEHIRERIIDRYSKEDTSA